MKFYVIQSGKRYWSDGDWVPLRDINKAVFFQHAVEARCVTHRFPGKITEMYISPRPPLLDKFCKGFKTVTDDGITLVKGPPVKGRKVTEHVSRTGPQKTKLVRRRTLNPAKRK